MVIMHTNIKAKFIITDNYSKTNAIEKICLMVNTTLLTSVLSYVNPKFFRSGVNLSIFISCIALSAICEPILETNRPVLKLHIQMIIAWLRILRAV